MKKSSWYKGYHKLRKKGYSKEGAYKTMNNFAEMINRNKSFNNKKRNSKKSDGYKRIEGISYDREKDARNHAYDYEAKKDGFFRTKVIRLKNGKYGVAKKRPTNKSYDYKRIEDISYDRKKDASNHAYHYEAIRDGTVRTKVIRLKNGKYGVAKKRL